MQKLKKYAALTLALMLAASLTVSAATTETISGRNSKTIDVKAIALAWYSIEPFQNPTTNGDAVRLYVHAKEVAEITKADGAINSIRTVAQHFKGLLHFVMFIPNLSNQLLKDILH